MNEKITGKHLERAAYVYIRQSTLHPANRLVAAELEARWNAALTQVSEAEARLQTEQHSLTPLTESQRQRLLALGADLQTLWHDPAASPELKKRILRTVVSEIIVDINHASEHLEMRIR